MAGLRNRFAINLNDSEAETLTELAYMLNTSPETLATRLLQGLLVAVGAFQGFVNPHSTTNPLYPREIDGTPLTTLTRKETGANET